METNFDPDAYLAKVRGAKAVAQQDTAFDPDAYLAKVRGTQQSAPAEDNGGFFEGGSIDSDVAAIAKKYNIPENDLWKKATMRGMTSDKAGVGEQILSKTMGVADSVALGAPSWLAKKFEDDNGEKAIDELYDVIAKKKSGIQNVAEFAGGVAAPAINVFKNAASGAGAAEKILRGGANAAVMGGTSGVANSKSGQEVQDGLFGLGVGGALGAAIPGAIEGFKNRGRIAHVLGAAAEGAYEGAKDTGGAAMIPVVGQVLATGNAVVGGVKKGRAANQMVSELEEAVAKDRSRVRPMPGASGEAVAVGSGKVLPNETGAFIDDLANVGKGEGESNLKTWVAHNAYAGRPSAGDPEAYKAALEMGTDRRNAARAFDANKAGEELAPTLGEFRKTFEEGRSKAFGELQEDASKVFEPGDVRVHLNNVVDEATSAVEKGLIDAKTAKTIQTARNVINEGESAALSKWNLGPGEFHDVPNTEQFNRLQRARQMLDKKIKYNDKKGILDENQELLLDARMAIDNALKRAEGKVTADSLYAKSVDIEKRLFEGLDFKGQKLDPRKLAHVMGDTDTAARFKTAIQDARAFYEEFGSKVGNADIAVKALDAVEAAQKMMADKQVLNKLRFEDGPSSMSVKLLGYMMQKFSLDSIALTNPAGYLGMLDASAKAYGKEVGKVPNWLQKVVMKMGLWAKRNPTATPEQVKAAARGVGVPENLIQ